MLIKASIIITTLTKYSALQNCVRLTQFLKNALTVLTLILDNRILI